MELHDSRVNSAMAKRLWNVLRVSFFMIRKGIMSKRKLIMDMNVMMKRGKLMRKTLTNLLFHHHHHHHHHHSKAMARGGFATREYEFSCSNSPNPVFFRVPTRNKHHFFPCINPPQVIEEEEDQEDDHEGEAKAVALMPRTPEYDFGFHFGAPGERVNKEDETLSPLLLSPFAVRVSNYSSEDEDEGGNYSGRVDDEAEEFIRRFHEQLRMQTRMQLLQY
ncbi:uncharacterized protein LOC115672436 [Syzygium oleosum]|uniref:uncharacterized protein LOC115672436 n=1 Tax=Syzygium oleosum TaxID=219896 RepID=UPI0024BBA1F2|nr:uncharacterized protein LOC115672436 [Syzygium oleosum]